MESWKASAILLLVVASLLSTGAQTGYSQAQTPKPPPPQATPTAAAQGPVSKGGNPSSAPTQPGNPFTGRALAVSRSFSGPPGAPRSCDVSLQEDNQFKPTDDDFGNPKFEIEDAYRNSVAEEVLSKYMQGRGVTSSGNVDLSSLFGSSGPNLSFNPTGVSNIFGGNDQSSLLRGPSNFNFGGNGFGQNPGAFGGGGGFGVPGGLGGGGGFNYFGRRRKRQAGFFFGGPQLGQTGQEECPSALKTLRAYRKYGDGCFVVKPDIQAISYASCPSKKNCSKCTPRNGISRCIPQQREVWAWSYCKAGPNAGKVSLEAVKIPLFCVCKSFQC